MQSDKKLVAAAEKEIDDAFSSNKLKDAGYAQAVWTLLSVVEDHNIIINHIDPLNDEQKHIYVDGLINWLRHPIQVCHSQAIKNHEKIKNILINEHCDLANKWLEASHDYSQFYSIFSLWHRSKIDISISGDELVTTDLWKTSPEYEAYNRIIRKDGKERVIVLDPNKVIDLIMPYVSEAENEFKVDFDPNLVSKLVKHFEPSALERYSLPDDWELSSFSFGNFKSVFITIQSMLWAWHLARVVLVQNGMPEYGYSSSVWLPKKDELITRLADYIGLDHIVVSNILKMLTFGESGVKNPDIAIQPLIDLENNHYALSPFVWLNTNVERNLCVLINQIEIEKKIYSKLTQEKENLLRQEITNYLEPLGYKIINGNVGETDVDVAIVDRKNSVCLCMELKWFIEPAEIREVHERSKELSKGIDQAKLINNLFKTGNERLISNLLSINKEYDFLAVVGSRNWIGHFDVQDKDIPIIKVWHLLENIKEKGSLSEVLSWLRNRDYLPAQGQDFSVHPMKISCGKWRSTWYGINTT